MPEKDDLFGGESESTPVATGTEQKKEEDPVKIRLKSLRSGDERLTKEDFTIDGKLDKEWWERYQGAIKRHEENAKFTYDNPEFIADQVKDYLKTLHTNKSIFAKFIPTVSGKPRGQTKPKVSGIPELDEFNKLCKDADKAFLEWRKTSPEYAAVEAHLKKLGLTSESTYLKDGKPVKIFNTYKGLEPYWRYVGVVKTWIKKNFQKKESAS